MNTTPSVENLKAFPLRSGTKQGDGENHYTYKTISWKIVIIIKTNKKISLSPFLFNIVLEVLKVKRERST